MKKRTGLISIILLTAFLLISIYIQPYKNSFTIVSYGVQEVNTSEFDHSYSTYNNLLNKYVKNARVDYQGFIDSRAEFETFLKSLGEVQEGDFQNWTEQQKLAFWINAYNAFTIKAIIDHYPINRGFSVVGIFYAPSNSILQIKGVWTKLQFRAVGRMVTLDEIEHQILRKKFNEPRIHMAINCASISCPDLSNEAHRADKLEEQLTSASANFVNNPQKGVLIDQESRKVKLSKIFKWFGEDFMQNYGSDVLSSEYSLKENAVLNFAAQYLESKKAREYVMKNRVKIGYLDYDWHLNEQMSADSS